MILPILMPAISVVSQTVAPAIAIRLHNDRACYWFGNIYFIVGSFSILLPANCPEPSSMKIHHDCALLCSFRFRLGSVSYFHLKMASVVGLHSDGISCLLIQMYTSDYVCLRRLRIM